MKLTTLLTAVFSTSFIALSSAVAIPTGFSNNPSFTFKVVPPSHVNYTSSRMVGTDTTVSRIYDTRNKGDDRLRATEVISNTYLYYVCEHAYQEGACQYFTHEGPNDMCSNFPDNWTERISTAASVEEGQICQFFSSFGCKGYFLELRPREIALNLKNWKPGPDGAENMNDVISSVMCWKEAIPEFKHPGEKQPGWGGF